MMTQLSGYVWISVFLVFYSTTIREVSMARLATLQMRPEKKSLFIIVARENFLFRGWYCWCKTSCTSWYDTLNMPLFLRVLYMPSGCLEFLPSTVLVTTHDVSCLQECLDERVHRLSLNHHGFGASLGSIVDQQWKVKVNKGLLLKWCNMNRFLTGSE